MSEGRPVERDLTLVVPTVGRPILRHMLASVVEGETWPARVVIVDQGRSPDVEAMAKEARGPGLDVVYVPSDRAGRSAGLNDGIRRVTTCYLAITDDDCLVATDWITRLAGRLRRHEPAIVTGRVVADAGEVQLSVVTSEVEDIQRTPRLRYDRLSGGNMGMPTETARQVGPFTEDACMRTAEDAEYAYRALRSAIPIVYAPEVVVRHVGWRDVAEREAQYRGYALSQGGFYGRYLRQGDAFMAARIVVHVARALRRWMMGVLRREPELARNGKAYATGLLPGLAAGWRSGGPP